ncbi:hypothetical protein [Oxynema aestuarii]|nr:hypothetical protein [Oxynema aestuarii]
MTHCYPSCIIARVSAPRDRRPRIRPSNLAIAIAPPVANSLAF